MNANAREFRNHREEAEEAMKICKKTRLEPLTYLRIPWSIGYAAPKSFKINCGAWRTPDPSP